MDDNTLLSQLSTEAFERLERVGGYPLRLIEPWKTIVLIDSAQGVIDNGGFVYFFENDWPHNTSSEEFAAAYERIGKWDAAKAIRDVVEKFGVDFPEYNPDARRAYI